VKRDWDQTIASYFLTMLEDQELARDIPTFHTGETPHPRVDY
jgi:hypothetical protein